MPQGNLPPQPALASMTKVQFSLRAVGRGVAKNERGSVARGRGAGRPWCPRRAQAWCMADGQPAMQGAMQARTGRSDVHCGSSWAQITRWQAPQVEGTHNPQVAGHKQFRLGHPA